MEIPPVQMTTRWTCEAISPYRATLRGEHDKWMSTPLWRFDAIDFRPVPGIAFDLTEEISYRDGFIRTITFVGVANITMPEEGKTK